MTDEMSPTEKLELAVAAGGKVLIAGREFPAPSAAALAVLELTGSPFLDSGDAPDGGEGLYMAVFTALYILGARDAAVPSILRWKRSEEALDALRVRLPDDSPQCALILAEQCRRSAEARADFEADALKYGETLGAFDPGAAAREIGMYLALAGGFDMLPDPAPGSVKKKDASTSTG